MYKKLLLLTLISCITYPISVVDFPLAPCESLAKDSTTNPFYCFPHRHYQIYKSFCYNKMCGSEKTCMEIVVEHVKGLIFKVDEATLPLASDSTLYKESPTYFLDNWAKYKDQINKGHEADVEIKFIEEEQFYGCFAHSALKAGDLIGVYAGEIWELQELNHILEEKYNNIHPSLCPEQLQSYRWHLPYEHANNPAKKYVIDAFSCRNCTAFINHSDLPNCVGIYASDGKYWYVLYIASKNIAAGEQLFADYGKDYWENRMSDKRQLDDKKSIATKNLFLK